MNILLLSMLTLKYIQHIETENLKYKGKTNLIYDDILNYL